MKKKQEILTALQRSINSTNNISNRQTLQKLSAIFNISSENWLEVDFSRWGNRGTDNEKFELLKSAVIHQKSVKITYANSYGTIRERIVQPLEKCNRTYRNPYMMESPNSRDLMCLFHQKCEENSIVHNNEQLFNTMSSGLTISILPYSVGTVIR